LHVEAAVVDRALARVRPGVLHEEHQPAGFRGQVFFVVRVRIEDDGAWSHGALADFEGALEDVPHLREIVAVARVMGSGLVADEARVGLARSLGARMEEHLALLAGEAQRLPGHVVDVTIFRTVVLRRLAHRILLRVGW
jgi:hypothetical protein